MPAKSNKVKAKPNPAAPPEEEIDRDLSLWVQNMLALLPEGILTTHLGGDVTDLTYLGVKMSPADRAILLRLLRKCCG